MPLLSIRDLSIEFHTEAAVTKAVKNISFDVDRGEIVAIVGESGSGKSVTALSILQLLSSPPTKYPTGEILFTDRNAQPVNLLTLAGQALRALRGKKISMIFQEPMTSLNPVFTCGDQVMEAIDQHENLGRRAAKERAIALLRQVKLPDPAGIFDRYPHQLSGGQKQRVMIAMAMSCNPSLLICDEPTTALDVTVQKNILQLIRELQQETQMGVIFITHDLGVVGEIADRAVVMYKGEIVEQGRTAEIFSAAKHPYTRALLACRPVLHKKGERLPTVADFMGKGEVQSQASQSGISDVKVATQIDSPDSGTENSAYPDSIGNNRINEIAPDDITSGKVYPNNENDKRISENDPDNISREFRHPDTQLDADETAVGVSHPDTQIDADETAEEFSHPDNEPKDPGISSPQDPKRIIARSPDYTPIAAENTHPILISAENLSVWFASRSAFGKARSYVKAVDNVSFKVYKGETLGLVGESGCGKTTLGRTLLRLIQPTSGKILYNGTDLANVDGYKLKSLRKDIQIIFQDPYSSLNPRITIGDAISEPLRVHGLVASKNDRRDRVVSLLEKVSLQPDHYNRYPHEFSGGQRQRIVIARALALNPSFLVCDESVSALDVSVQAQVLNLLNDLKKEFGFTVVFISHDLAVVHYVSDRIMVMNKGRIEEIGPADEVYHRPQTAYTKKLVESIPKGIGIS